jgi:hypothetical protein
MSEKIERIMGTETEYSVILRGDVKYQQRTDDEAMDERYGCQQLGLYAAQRAIIGSYENYGVGAMFLTNGARYYMETGGHPEFAASEDNTITGAVANELAGEEIVRDTFALTKENDPQQNDRVQRFAIQKRSNNGFGLHCGWHDNYSVLSERFDRTDLNYGLLGVHGISRALFGGAGMIGPAGEYYIAQKLPTFEADIGAQTMNHTNLVNTKAEDFCKPNNEYRRIHMVNGDHQMSPWGLRMTLGTTSLILTLIEQGDAFPELRFKNSLHNVAQDAGRHVNINKPYRMVGDMGVMSLLDVQEALYHRVLDRTKDMSLDADLEWVVDEWGKFIADFKREPTLVQDRVEWAIKLALLKRQAAKKGLTFNSDPLRQMDWFWDRIDVIGPGQKLRESLWSAAMPPETLIKERMILPSPTTRAASRGEFVDRFGAAARQTTRTIESQNIHVDWNSLIYFKHNFNIGDPFIPVTRELRAFFKKAHNSTWS